MNAGTSSNRLLNSLIPARVNSATLPSNSYLPNASKKSSLPIGLIVFSLSVVLFLSILYLFKDHLQIAWNSFTEYVTKKADPDSSKEHTNVTAPSPQHGEPGEPAEPSIIAAVENVLPGGNKEVFNISSNRYTYYDAEPLCKALGAELATYDQVKEAWAKGADWCNYGWVKGQMAVYPTSDETYQKMQAGSPGQQMACGRPGINGGFFDNPELRFGATCYGNKPPQSKHDEKSAAQATPVSPDALDFDKKVAQFKSQADTIGILPFNSKRWE